MSEITFRADFRDEQSSGLRERDRRIAELEELLREAQEIASIGRLEVTPAEVKALSENEHLKRRKNQLTKQLQQIQEEFLLSTTQFDAEISELRRHVEVCELKMLALSERESSEMQTESCRARAVAHHEHFRQDGVELRRDVTETTHFLVTPEPGKNALDVDMYNNRIHIRKLNLLPMNAADDETSEENNYPANPAVRRLSRSNSEDESQIPTSRQHIRRPSLIAKIRSAQGTPRSLLSAHTPAELGTPYILRGSQNTGARGGPGYGVGELKSSYADMRPRFYSNLSNSLPLPPHPLPPALLSNRIRRRVEDPEDSPPYGLRHPFRRFGR